MRLGRRLALVVVAGVAGVAIAGTVASADSPRTTVTLGSTSGTPAGNIGCGTAAGCTYLPTLDGSTPAMQVTSGGTVTSFSINAGSAGGTVRLRVLRPASGGKFTGAGTSPTETLNVGMNTFAISLPVQAGDVLGLDNATSALMFDLTSATPVARYYDPPLTDGTTQAPNHSLAGYRLLMSATVQSGTTTTTTGTTTTGTTTPPTISAASLTHKRFRIAKGKTAVSAASKPPKGTSFLFTLSAAAKVQIAISHTVPGRRMGGKCVKPTPKLATAKRCKRTVTVVTLTRASEPKGANSVAFTGRWDHQHLKPGSYKATVTASNAGGVSKAVPLAFKVVK